MEHSTIIHQVGKDPHFKVWHTLEEAMILYTYSEGGSIVCNEGSYPILRGTLCFVGAGCYHYTMPDEPNAYDRTKLFISPTLLSGLTGLLEDGSGLRRFSGDAFVYAPLPEEGRIQAEEILDTLEADVGGGYADAALAAAILRLLTLLDRHSLQSKPATSELMSRAIDYINRNLFTELSIDGICGHIHVSKYHFCRSFKRRIGMTVMEYVLKTRIAMAKNLLEKEQLSVTEISNRCGFSSSAYFSRVFKEEAGVSPLRYRKQRISER